MHPLGRGQRAAPEQPYAPTAMSHTTAPTLLVALALLSACGGADSAPSSGAGADARKPTAEPQATKPAPSGGLTDAQFRALRLRTPRAELVSTIGEPTRVTKAERGSECLQYKALDAQGAVVDTQRYTLCFDAQDQLSVLTTTPIIR